MECAVEGCSRPARSRGWCNTHYERWRRTGEVGEAGDARTRPAVECSVDDCDRQAVTRGWCNKHYVQWRATGDPIPQIRPNYGEKRRVMDSGYVEVWEPDHPLAMKDGYVLEHRKVAWDAGLLTDPALLVHHHDEDRANNEIGNLRVKTNPDHARDHVYERGTVKNQYGEWPVRKRRGEPS